MPILGVTVAILADERILLTQREDFEVWCLPGGHVDDGESIAAAAVREAREETGLTVALTRLVGVYSRPRWWQGSMHLVLFAARPIGGALRLQPGETIDAGWFDLTNLPERSLLGHRQYIEDATAGWGGSLARRDDTPWPLDPRLTRAELYALRDQSGLGRADFYASVFPPDTTTPGRLEVAGRRADNPADAPH